MLHDTKDIKDYRFASKDSKYKARADDSSSDDESDKSELKGLEYFEEAVERAEDLARAGIKSSDLRLSYFAHEFGLRILKAPEVSSLYLTSLFKHLGNNTTLSDQDIANCIDNSVRAAILEVLPEDKARKKALADNKLNIQKLTAAAKKDKREFIQAVQNNDIQGFLKHSKLAFDFPKQGKIKHFDYLLGLLQEIHAQVGIAKSINVDPAKTKISCSKVGKNLSSYASTNPDKVKIAEKLQSIKIAISFDTFIKVNCKDIKLVNDNTKTLFLGKLNKHIALQLQTAKKDKMHRQTLPDDFIFPTSGPYSVAKFLAYTRLLHRSNTRLSKNLKDNKSMLGDQKDTTVVVFRFPGIGSNSSAIMTNQVNGGSSTKNALVETSFSYYDKKNSNDIVNRIATLQSNLDVDDKEVAELIRKTLKGEIADSLAKLEVNPVQKQELAKFLNSTTFLLFGTEVIRNPASLITNSMMLDLIMAGELTWEDALKIPVMPMAMTDAVMAVRWAHLHLKTSSKYAYDRTEGERIGSHDSKEVHQLIRLEGEIFRKWLAFKKIKETEFDDIIEAISAASRTWYNIEVEPKQILVERIANIAKLDEESLEELSRNELLKLLEIVNNELKNFQPLYEAGVSISSIINVFNEDIDKFKAVASDNAVNLIKDKDSEISFDDICTFYDECNDEDKFNRILEDEDDLISEFGLTELLNRYNKYAKKVDNDEDLDFSVEDVDPYKVVAYKHVKDSGYDLNSHTDSDNEDRNSSDDERQDSPASGYSSDQDVRNDDNNEFVQDEDVEVSNKANDQASQQLDTASNDALMREMLKMISSGQMSAQYLPLAYSNMPSLTYSESLNFELNVDSLQERVSALLQNTRPDFKQQDYRDYKSH